MRSIERWLRSALRQGLKLGAGMLVGLYLAAPVYAFTPAPVPLLSASAVPPNLMLLMDDSGSMNNIIWATGFNPNDASLPAIYKASCFITCSRGTAITADNVLLSSLSTSGCSGSSTYSFYRTSTTVYCLKLPDPVKNGNTYYTSKYLAYLVKGVGATATSRDYTSGSAAIPNTFRMGVAKSVATTLVTNNRAIRIGLASLNPSGLGDKIVRTVGDISTQSSFDALKASIAALNPDGGTPLAETYYEITRYFRGMKPYYSNASTYTSPIQYRCQKNYGVVVTDGLPSNDRDFPGNDPEDPDKLLPNWDRVNNDGPNAGGNADGDTLYLDDIAKFAYDIDMRKATSTPASDLAGKGWDTTAFQKQNMSTYTVGFTVSNQMLVDAADNDHGHGTYYQANDSDGLTDALNAALSDINAKAGSGGAGATNSSTLQEGTRFYQTLYDPKDWHGTIKAFPLSAATGAVGTSPSWSTDTTMAVGGVVPVLESLNTETNKVISLAYANFSVAQKAVLDRNLPTGLNGTDLINWTKGTNKAGLRVRTQLLGDIINSPLASAQPGDKTAADLVGDTTYTDYLVTKKAMISSLVVNANDGFVHVINAVNGGRRYGYMPSTVLPALSTVSDVDYGAGLHKFTVDGQVGVYDTQLVKSGTWQTVAVGGTGAGGRAYYALQLFDGSAGNVVKALWEIRAPDIAATSNPFNNLGYAYSRPAMARMADGTGIVVIGNGYGSNTGVASLFVLNAKDGSVLAEIPTPAIVTGETDNGLSSVRLQVNAQNVVQAAYAGDLKGRLWKFDMSSTSASGWTVAFGRKPLFTALGGANQPITALPLLADHPTNGKLVYFGTGKFNEIIDKQSTAQQSFYAIWDSVGGAGNYTQGSLQAQAIVSAGGKFFTTTRNEVDWTSKKGWFIPLVADNRQLGERVIYPAQISRGRIIFTSAAVDSSDPCESTGTGRLFELDAEKGKMLAYAVLDTNGDGIINDTDTISSGINFGAGLPNLAAIVSGPSNDTKYVPDSSGTISVLVEKGGEQSNSRRIMWRQIQ